MKKELSRLDLEVLHHTRLKDMWYNHFNKLPDNCVKRRAHAQARFNFHRTRIDEIQVIKKPLAGNGGGGDNVRKLKSCESEGMKIVPNIAPNSF
jgi:hypothetical protein